MEQINSAATLGRSVEQLQSFCRGEMSAVETYKQAIGVTNDPNILLQLRHNLASHEARVQLLRNRIIELGGKPPESSGPWGTLVKAAEATASVLGEKSALSVLEEGEDHGLKDYKEDIYKLDFDSQRLVSDLVLPQQVQTHRVLSDIKRTMI